MAGGGGGLEDNDPLSVGSYSRLLLSDDMDDLDAQNCFNFTPSFCSSEQSGPKMLCFGDDDHFNRDECDLFFDEITAKIAEKTAGITCSDSSSASSTTTINTTSTVSTTTHVSSLTKSNKKKNPLGAGAVNNSDPVGNSGMANGAPVGKQRNCKRTKSADDSTETTTGRHAKVKKEKLGERVIALQQLVSPFGKTDTASVLHEAMGYIRFLQDQVQVLCSPYLQRLPSSAHLLEEGGEEEEGKESESRKDLRSKGLCLVPIELTVHVAEETNGADFWSPAMVNKLSSHQ